MKAWLLKVVTCKCALRFPVSIDCLGEVTAAAYCEGLPQANLTVQSSDHLGPGPSWQARCSLTHQVGFVALLHPAFFPSLNKPWLKCRPRLSKQESALN